MLQLKYTPSVPTISANAFHLKYTPPSLNEHIIFIGSGDIHRQGTEFLVD